MAAFPARDRDAFMAHWTRLLGDQTEVAMTILVNGCVAGFVGCWTKDGQRLVGYWVGQQYWGKGVATKMLSMFLGRVADRPLRAHVAKHNVASIRVLEKCGFALCAEAAGAPGETVDGVEELVYVIDASPTGDTESNMPPDKAVNRSRR
jgi:RimJ/RimL family protein N-acetyltransferase